MKKHFFLLLAFLLLPTSTSQCMNKPDKGKGNTCDLIVGYGVMALILSGGAYWVYRKYNPTPIPTPPQNPSAQQPAAQQPNTAQTNEPAIPQSIFEDVKKEINLHEEQQKSEEQTQTEEKKSILTETKPADTQPILNQPNINHAEKKPQQCSGQQCSIKKSSDETCNSCDAVRRHLSDEKTFKRHLKILETWALY